MPTKRSASKNWLDKKWTLKKEVIFKKNNEDEIVAINTSDPQSIFKIEKYACALWLQINGKNSVKDLVKSTATNLAISETEAQNKVKGFLKDLEKMNLITPSGTP